MVAVLGLGVSGCGRDRTDAPGEFPALAAVAAPVGPLTVGAVSARANVIFAEPSGTGVVTASTDRGATWVAHDIGPARCDGIVPRPDGTALVLSGDALLTFDPADGTTAALPTPPGFTGPDAFDVAPDGRIFVIPPTADTREAYVLPPGGTAWDALPALDATEGFRRIQVAADGTVWVTGAFTLRTLASDSASWTTTRAVGSYEELFVTAAGTILLYNDTNGTTLRRSVDGGDSFTVVTVGPQSHDPMREHDGTLYWGTRWSTDEGATWQDRAHVVVYADDDGLFALDRDRAVLVELDHTGRAVRALGNQNLPLYAGMWPARSGGGVFLVTHNGGGPDRTLLTWDPDAGRWHYPGPVSLPTTDDTLAFQTSASDDVCVTDGVSVHCSPDLGATWTSVGQTGLSAEEVLTVDGALEDPTTGDWYVAVRVCGDGVCRDVVAATVRSTDRGATWSLFAPTVGVTAIAPDGVLFGMHIDPLTDLTFPVRSVDGGASWDDADALTFPDAISDDGLWVHLTPQTATLEVSTDGEGWTLLTHPDPAVRLTDVGFDGEGHLWVQQVNLTGVELAWRSVAPL